MTSLADFKKIQKTEYKLFGVPIHALSMEQVIQEVNRMLQDKQQGYLVTADASAIVTATKNSELLKIIQNAAIVTPDSMGILWAISKLYSKVIQKVGGVELAEHLCKLSAEKGYKIFLLGAEPGIAEIAARKLNEKYPGCQIIGAMHGFFSEQEDSTIAKKIASLNPDILFVALGMPRQEKFLYKNLSATNAIIGIGIGGSLDVYSQKVKRAPKWFQRNSLEWLWRFALNPTKIYKVKMLPNLFEWLKKNMAKIYTKTGDKGNTGLVGGKRLPKDSCNIEAIGVIDELNAYLGVCIAVCNHHLIQENLKEIQCRLFDAGAQIATPLDSPYHKKYIHQENIEKLENMIDEYTAQLGELKNFILPGGNILSAHLHYARTLCRRAERQLIAFSREQEVDILLKAFFNRLSDWLFALARLVNKLENVQDVPWTSTQ